MAKQDRAATDDALHDCHARATIWHGEQLLADTLDAVATAFPESNGELLVPEADVDMERCLALGAAGPVIVRKTLRAGRDYVIFDPAQVRIDLTDRRPGAYPVDPTTNGFPRWGDVTDLIASYDLEGADDGVYRAPAMGLQRRNVMEGTQLLGQAIVAASREAPGQRVVSADIVVCRAAAFDEAVDLQAQVRHRGRTFSTVTVSISQRDKMVASVLTMLDSGAPDVVRQQVAMPDVPAPEKLEEYDCWISGRQTRFIGGYVRDPDDVGPPELHAWVRFRDAPEELAMRQAMLVHFMGRNTVASAMRPHKDVGIAQAHISLSTAVLACKAALHEDPDLSDWLLYTCSSIYAGRGLAQVDGRVFERSGRLVASATTQVLLRRLEQDPAKLGGSSRVM